MLRPRKKMGRADTTYLVECWRWVLRLSSHSDRGGAEYQLACCQASE